MSVEAADRSARYQINYCKRHHHGPHCRREACNLAREWVNLRRATPRGRLIEEVALMLRDNGAGDVLVRMVRWMKGTGG